MELIPVAKHQVDLQPGAIIVSLEPGAISVNLKPGAAVHEDRAVHANLRVQAGVIRVNFQNGAIRVNLRQSGARRVNFQPGAVRVDLQPNRVNVDFQPDDACVALESGDVHVNLEPGAVRVNLQTDNVNVQLGAAHVNRNEQAVHVNLHPGAVCVNLQPGAVRVNSGPWEVNMNAAVDDNNIPNDAVHVNLEDGAVHVLGHNNVQVIIPANPGQVHCMTEEALTHVKLKCACMIMFFIIIVIVTAKMGLLIARYSNLGEICELNKTIQDGLNSLPDHFRVGYIFTAVMWAIINLLRVIEYVVLGIATLHFIYTYPRSVQIYLDTLNNKRGKVIKFTLGLLVLLGPYLLLVIGVPTFNILKELEYEKMSPCYNRNVEYFTYTAVNYLRYLCAFSVRVAFVLTTVIIREIWRESLKSIPLDVPDVPDVRHNDRVDQHLTHWNNTAEHLKFWISRYNRTGEVVKQITEIFQTWFIIPWLIFFIISSLDVKYTLQPWSDKSGSTMARISYLVFDLNQVTGLLLPFLCATLINSYHRDFYKRMKENLLRGCTGASEQAIAQVQFNIDKEEAFDFVARIPCTDIEMRLDSPIFLLLGLFFTISKPIFSYMS